MGKYPVIGILAAVLLGFMAGCSDPRQDRGARNDNLVMATAAGDSLEWVSLRGDWVLVNYWAEWCRPCLDEIPELNRLDTHDGITVLAVNYDGVTGQELRALGQRMAIRFTMLAEDPAPAFGWQVPSGLPATFLVSPDGELQETLMGAQTEAGLLARMKRD